MKVTRRRLEELAEKATGIPMADSSIQHSWVTEALESGGDGKTADARHAADALYRLARDIEDFAHAICEYAASASGRVGD